jgi:hypothetical protein
MKAFSGICLCFILLASGAMAQKGEWYTWSTGSSPVTHLSISKDEIVLELTPVGKQGGINGRTKKEDTSEHLKIEKRVEKNDRNYLIFQSFDGLYFAVSFKESGDSLLMYCADGADDGYKGLNEALEGINKDKGTDFFITLLKKEAVDKEMKKGSVARITAEEFGAALQNFTTRMDQFWQARGYGRYEPYHGFMNLIYGNAFANAFGDKYSKLSLTTKELKVPIESYKGNTTIKRLLESAGFLKGQ